MTRHRKEDIIDVAQALFNERGYHVVSLRDVAEQLQISKGNLTYHFQKKEDLIEACALETYDNWLSAKIPDSLEALNGLLTQLVEHRGASPFYFYNLAQLPRLCPQLPAPQGGYLAQLQHRLTEGIRGLTRAKVFRRDCLPVYEGLVQGILSVLIHGIPGDEKATPEDQLICIWSMLVPCLTEVGKADYAALFQ